MSLMDDVFLDESGGEKSLQENSQILATHVYDEMSSTML